MAGKLRLGKSILAKTTVPYACRRTTGRIRLDGRLDEAAWRQANILTGFLVAAAATNLQTIASALERPSYFGAEMEDADIYGLHTDTILRSAERRD